MIVLGIETASSFCGVGLVSDSGAMADFTFHGSRHAEQLGDAVGTVLETARIDRSSLDGIAVSIGPGSFTGLRIGMGLAKGLALGLGKPLAAVPTMEAVASRIPSKYSKVCVWMTARKAECYEECFRPSSGGWESEGGIRLVDMTALDKENVNEETVYAGDGALIYREALERLFPNARFLDDRLTVPNGYAVARMGMEKLKNGSSADLDSLVPMYVKRFQGVL
jgi:tRNA threonylcarbamoyladenosine biosynthesis protein TsaB